MSTYATLNADITAVMLAMAAVGEDGYPAEHVIGPKGSTVRIIDDDGDFWIEVDEFANDPYAAGFVLRADLDWPSD